MVLHTPETPISGMFRQVDGICRKYPTYTVEENFEVDSVSSSVADVSSSTNKPL